MTREQILHHIETLSRFERMMNDEAVLAFLNEQSKISDTSSWVIDQLQSVREYVFNISGVFEHVSETTATCDDMTPQQKIDRADEMLRPLMKYEADLIDITHDASEDRMIVILRACDDTEISLTFDFADIDPRIVSEED